MRFYKFLAKGAIGPDDRRGWPTPSASREARWVEADDVFSTSVRAVEACRLEDLPYWLDEELWEFEFEGPYEASDRRVVGRRGRLVRRIEMWNADSAMAFAAACVDRSRGHAAAVLRAYGAPPGVEAMLHTNDISEIMAAAYEPDVSDIGSDVMTVVHDAGDVAFAVHTGMAPSLVALVAARTAASAAKATHGSPGAAEDEERLWQAGWLATRLGLTARR